MYQQCGPSDSSGVQGCKIGWCEGPNEGQGDCASRATVTFITGKGMKLYPNIETEPTNQSIVLHNHCFHYQPFISTKNTWTESALDVSE